MPWTCQGFMAHSHHPAPPPQSLPITQRQPSPLRRACPAPHRPSPGEAASPLSAPPRPSPPQQWGVSNQQNRRRDSPPQHCRASNSGSVPTPCRKARPAPSVPSRSARPVPASQDMPAPRRAAPALRHPAAPTTPPTLPSPLPLARTVGLRKDPTKLNAHK